jgi:hypothetical protein
MWGPVDLGGSYDWANAAWDGNKVFTVNSSGQMRAFDDNAGTPLWTVQLPSQRMFSSPPTPIPHSYGLLFTGGSGTGGTVYAVRESDGSVAWTASVLNGDDSSPAVSDTGVYVSYACAQAYDFEPLTGALIWHHETSCEGGGGKTPVLYQGKLYVRDASLGNTILDASTGAGLGTFSGSVAPAFSGSTGFFLNGSTLQAVDLSSGSVLWSFSGDGTLDTAPLLVNGQVYVGGKSGNLYAVNAATGAQTWSASTGSPINGPDEQNLSQPLTGLGAGYDFLVVPAGNTLTLYEDQLSVAPGSLDFGPIPVGSTQSSTAYVVNNTPNSISIGGVTATGPFTLSNGCPALLNGLAACTINVTFNASGAGMYTGALTIDDGAANSPQTIALTGEETTGVATSLKLTPASVTVTAGQSQGFAAEGYDAAGAYQGNITPQAGFNAGAAGSCTANVCTLTKAGTQTVGATYQSGSGSATVTVKPAPLDHLVLSPAGAAVTAGGSQSYTAEGFDQYGNDLGDTTASASFSISPNGSCTGATCTATVAGLHTVYAYVNGHSGNTTLTVNPGPFDHITISPSSASMPAGGSQAYSAEAYDQYGNDLGAVTSASSFSISPDGSCGGATCTATTTGIHTVTASYNGKTATAQLSVFGGPIDHVAVTPASATIAAGSSQAYNVEAYDQYGNDLGSVTSGSTVSIAPDGTCTGASCTTTVAGAHTVTGTYAGKSATASLTVTPAAPSHVVLSPASATIAAGGSQAYTAVASDQYGNSYGDVTANTSFYLDGNTGKPCSGSNCSTTTAGAHTVDGAFGGVVGTASLTVTAGTLDHITLSPASSSIIAGGSQAYTVEGFDAYNNDLGSFTANSSLAIAPDGSCSAGSCSATRAGSHTVTAASQGKSASASLSVNAGALSSLTVSPASATLVVGQTQTFNVTGADAYGNAVSASGATWSVGSGTPGSVSPAGGASTTFTSSPTATGTGSVRASVGSVTGSASVTVLPAAPASLAATVAGKKVNLTWQSAAGAVSYRVYRGTSSSNLVLIKSGLTTTSFTDMPGSGTFYYAVTAVGSTGLESARSNTVSAKVN